MTASTGKRHRGTVEERFWSKIEKTDACWLWIGGLFWDGYGMFTFARDGKRSTVRAHRFAYELLVGPIPAGMTLDHVRNRGCVNRNCVNPAHLEPVTKRVNTLRGATVPAANAAKTHCPNGHPFDEANTYITKQGWRGCRSCNAESARKRRAARSHG